jgi:hypothetical protein
MRCLCLTLVFAATVMTTVPDANQAASKPPGPISEQDYDAIMKKVGPSFTETETPSPTCRIEL